MSDETNSSSFNRAQGDIKKYRGLSLLNAIGGFLIVFAFVVWGAGLLYTGYLNGQIISLEEEIEKFREPLALEDVERKQSIEEVIQVDRAIDRGEQLLNEQQSIAPIFDVIERYTLVDVRYKNFLYDAERREISLSAIAFDDRAFAEQLLVYQDASEFSDISFDRISLAGDGSVSFQLMLHVDKSQL